MVRGSAGRFGKWHLYGGGATQHGYDEHAGDTDKKTSRPDDPPDDPQLMFSITRRSVDFIERQAKAGRPFFVQISHDATHARYQATKKTRERYEKNPVFAKIAHPRDRQNAILGAAMAEDLDSTIGQLLQTLDTLGRTENTCVVFTTANGYRTWKRVPRSAPRREGVALGERPPRPAHRARPRHPRRLAHRGQRRRLRFPPDLRRPCRPRRRDRPARPEHRRPEFQTPPLRRPTHRTGPHPPALFSLPPRPRRAAGAALIVGDT